MNELSPGMQGFLTFFVSLCVIGFLAHFLCGADPSGDPVFDKQNEPRPMFVGACVWACSIGLGLLAYIQAKRANQCNEHREDTEAEDAPRDGTRFPDALWRPRGKPPNDAL